MTQTYLMNTHLAILGHGTNFWVNQKVGGAGQILKTFSNLHGFSMVYKITILNNHPFLGKAGTEWGLSKCFGFNPIQLFRIGVGGGGGQKVSHPKKCKKN